MKKIFILITVILLVILGTQYVKREAPVSVTVATVSRGTVQANVSNTRAGTVKSCHRSKLSLPLGGQVTELSVKEGQQVVKGQILLQLWNEDQVARVKQAQATLSSIGLKQQQSCLTAEFDLRESKRLQRLVENALTSEESVDNAVTQAKNSALACRAAKADIQVAQATLDLQRALLDKTILRAPFDGTVAEINGEIGEHVTPSPPGVATPAAVDLIDTTCLYVTAPIDEIDAGMIAIGLPARISLDAFADREFSAELTRIAPYVVDLEKQARTVDVDVRFSPPPEDIHLLVGYSADVTLILESRENVLRIPTEAVMENNQVLVVKQSSSELEARSIKPGISNWSFVEVLEGLEQDEQVVLSLDAPGVEIGATVQITND